MILENPDQIKRGKPIENIKGDTQHQMRCYLITNTNQYLKRETIN